MEITELDELAKQPTKLVDAIKALAPEVPEEAINFEPEKHKIVTDMAYRPDRKVDIPTNTKDAEGNEIYRPEYKPVHRIPSALRKTIVDWSVNLALSNGIDIQCSKREGVASDEVMQLMLEKTWQDVKMDYIAKTIEEIKQKYLSVMLVWYSVEAEEGFWDGIAADTTKFKMRCTVLSPKDGDTIVPIRDQYKDMIGAARLYNVKIEGKDVEKMDLFLNDKYLTYAQSTTGWVEEASIPIKYGKANFIYDEQERTEWADVSAKIERVSEILSDTADENQLSAFPILAASGDILASSGGGANTRKVMKMENGGKLEYIEAKGGSQNAKNELDNLYKDIFVETNTPQISMETLNGSGSIPGVAIELAFLPATNKARSKQQGSIGMFHQRNLNFLKSAMAVINTGVAKSVSMEVKPEFSISLPINKKEESEMIIALVNAGLMSKETALRKLKTVEDFEAELLLIAKNTPSPTPTIEVS